MLKKCFIILSIITITILTLSIAFSVNEQMEIYVSQIANFAIYKPAGWEVLEDVDGGMQYIYVVSPGGDGVEIYYQEEATTEDVYDMMGALIQVKGEYASDFTLVKTYISSDKRKLVFDATYSDPEKGSREGRFWISLNQGKMFIAIGETKKGNFEAQKETLLSIISNVRIIQGANFYGNQGGQVPEVLPLEDCRLSDGSAYFKIPAGWTYQDMGKTCFIAGNASEEAAFLSTSIDFITPDMGVQVQGVPVSYYLHPHEAFAFIMEQQGFGSDFEFLMVTPREDIAGQMAQVYTAGTVEVSESLYTFYNKEGTGCKGFTMGICFYSRTGTNWNLKNVTFIAPEEKFDSLIPTFVEMGYSYRIDEAWAANYVEEGMKNLARLQAQTASVIARTSAEISEISNSIYEGKKESQDYIDYLTTSYIRGESDWISTMEGGNVYHSDSWGLTDTGTGTSYEGTSWDYVHFEGQNPVYNEDMIYVDSKEAWKEAFGQ